jgi:hypothetical protein
MPQIQIGAIWCTQLNFSFTPPSDPRFRGWQMTTMDRSTGFVYDERRVPAQYGGPEASGIAAMFPTPSMLKEVIVWAASYSDIGVNPIVPGVTPMATVTVGRTGSLLDLTLATPNTLQTAAFASTIRPVEIVATLPVSFTDYPQGAVVFLTSDNKLYRSTGTAWTKVIDATDIPDRTLAASKMIALSITSNELAADSATFGKVAAAAVGTRELVTGELLVGLGGGKPTKFKVVDGFGQWVCFIGYDPPTALNGYTSFTGFAATNARIGPDINNPSFYCDGTGAWLQNVPLSFSNASLTTIIDSAYDSLFGVWASFKTHVTPDPLHPELGGAYPTYIAPGGIGCVKSTVDSTALWALSTSGLFLFDVSAPTNPLHAAALYPWINGSPALYLGGNRVVGPRKTGWEAATGTATRTSFATTTVTLPQLAERVKAIIDDLLGHGAFGA